LDISPLSAKIHSKAILGRRILVVDDDLDACIFYKTCLEENDFHVVIYTNPVIAASRFLPDIYDLIFIDIRMPVINGFELYEIIKKIDNRAKVCFITAFDEYYESLKEQFTRLDAKYFIRKPIGARELVRQVISILSNNRKK
jgi:DNA-binding response OmpR family regulator